MPVVDLFCGCGGLSKGFELAGFDIVAAFDGWQSAIKCYNANFNHQAIACDLSNVDSAVNAITPFHPTIIIGGPPCQEFSNAGRREEGERADLTYKYAEIVTRILPDYFVMENVPRAQQSKAFAKAKQLYKNHNYGLTEIVLDASRCGVPQKRNRFFCIGARNTSDNFLLDSFFRELATDEISVRQYFEDHHIQLDIENYYRHPTTYSRRAIFSVNEASPTIRGVNRPKPDTYKRHPNDSVEANELEGIRSLTLSERAAIQTFPQDFRFEDLDLSRGELEQMVGNAVPVLLAQYVAERLLEYMNREIQNNNDRDAFAEWLRTEKKYTSDRSISDVFSRLNRAQRILPNHEINKYFIIDLQDSEEYKKLDVSVRSQIKKAILLRCAFDAWREENE